MGRSNPTKPTVVMVRVGDLIPYARNARTHSDAQVAQIAASIKEFGWTNPILVDGEKGLIAGHGRLAAARKLGMEEVPVIELTHLSETQKKALILADNKLALNAGWDAELLNLELEELELEGVDLDLVGFGEEERNALRPEVVNEGLTDEDAVPEPPPEPITKPGDIWLLGKHRLMCGDSTSVSDVEKLMNNQKAQLLHADPPYGMGKENDGVANDNLYREKLDAFQMEWWATFRTFIDDNASVYIWGNAPDLWRLWYVSGLSKSEGLTIRNQIIWNKKFGHGINNESHRMYATTTEHCLFFMVGEQGFNNNADNYWDGWDSLRNYLVNEKLNSGLSNDEIKAVTNSTHSHYWAASQWQFPTKEHYEAIKLLAKGKAFKREYDDLKREYDDLKREFYKTRAYFDNTHDHMTDVWDFSRVSGEERHGHATPKPVAMMERVMKSSLSKGSLCVEPFAGSGSTLIGAEKTQRICYAMELQPKYCDVIVKRWEEFTGQKARLENAEEIST
jgi:ParB-like chromosome segregation protein Spo0J